MLLTFSRDTFEEKIKKGAKIHTLRKDRTGRWKKGNKIHFWRGSPRNVQSNPYPFGEGVCSEVIACRLDPHINKVEMEANGHISLIDSPQDLDQFARNDGFESWEEMKKWFSEPFSGKLIYWEKCRFYT